MATTMQRTQRDERRRARALTRVTLGESFARVIFDEIRTAAKTPIVEEPRTTGPGTATFADSGVAVDTDGDTPLLEVAEAAGLQPRFGCRRGVCRRCAVDMTCGAVRNLADGTRTDTPGTRIKICVNAADGDVTLPI